jgi:alanyl-tRNA synthetase
MERTYREYMEDTYRFASSGVIVQVAEDENGRYAVLDRSIFHPQGGGQPSDTGVARGVARWPGADVTIARVLAPAGELRHYGPFPAGCEGTTVELQIDGHQRMIHARLHSAGHVVAAVVESVMPECRAVKGHHFPGEAYVEFTGDRRETPEMLSRVQSAVTKALHSGACLRVEIQQPPSADGDLNPSSPVRLVSFGTQPPVPCGGTHVGCLSELAGVIVSRMHWKSRRLRVSYCLGG